MDGNNNMNQSFFSNTLINDYVGFLSGWFEEDAAKANAKQTNQRNNDNNDSDSFLSD